MNLAFHISEDGSGRTHMFCIFELNSVVVSPESSIFLVSLSSAVEKITIRWIALSSFCTTDPGHYNPAVIKIIISTFREQVGILFEHALEFARLAEKRLGTSKFSNSIFERLGGVFDLVFSSNPVFINLSNY